MMEQKPASKKLSKAVLELKFMKKSKEKALVQEENEERQQLYQDQLSSLHEAAEKIVMVDSYVDCFKFLPCRLSFGGMDQDIEKLNEDKLTGLYTVVKAKPKETVTEMNADISAKEMASHYHQKAHRQNTDHQPQQEEEEVEEKDVGDFQSPNDQKESNQDEMKALFMHRNRGRGRPWRGRGRGRGGRNNQRNDSRGFGKSGNEKKEFKNDFRGRGGFPRGHLGNTHKGGQVKRGHGQGDNWSNKKIKKE